MSINITACAYENGVPYSVFSITEREPEIYPCGDPECCVDENPQYIKDSCINLANGNAYWLIDNLGFDSRWHQNSIALPIPEVLAAIAERAVLYKDDEAMDRYFSRLHHLCFIGARRGATHIVGE